MTDLALNNPSVRQSLLLTRLQTGKHLVALDLAQEFGISLDTIRRDLLALEDRGLARRVRGGAIPVRSSAPTYAERLSEPEANHQQLVRAALPFIKDGMTIAIGGGTTTTHLAQAIEPLDDLFVITPAPAVASITLSKGIDTFLVGGRLSPWGACAVGAEAQAMLLDLAVDIAFPGICALHHDFGFSMDYADEAGMTRAMVQAADQTILVCAKEKIGQRARHRILPLEDLSRIVTDADADIMQPFKDAGLEICYA